MLLEKLKSKQATIGIIGLGYVGVPLALRYCEEGYKVIGFDVDEEKIAKWKRSEGYIKHIPSERLQAANQKGFQATADFSKIAEVDAIIICVPTPLNKYREPDLSYVVGTMESMMPHLHSDQIISLESTTYPGTTDEEIVPRIESKGFKIGQDYFVVFSPEREDPGNPKYTTVNIPKVVGGVTDRCLEAGIELYNKIIKKIVPVSSVKVAEMTKLLENIHRAVNIGLVNEMKIVTDKMGIDIYEVIDAAATKPFGFTSYYPGPGLGGHCIPIDPFYLTWKAREYGIHTRFIELAGEINGQMVEWVVGKTVLGLNNQGKALKNSKILIVGLAYKRNIDDTRESPAVEIIELLHKQSALISYHDPFVLVFPKMRKHSFDLKSIELTPENIRSYDCIIIATDHDEVDYALLQQNAKLIIDTRGKYRKQYTNVIKA